MPEVQHVLKRNLSMRLSGILGSTVIYNELCSWKCLCIVLKRCCAPHASLVTDGIESLLTLGSCTDKRAWDKSWGYRGIRAKVSM